MAREAPPSGAKAKEAALERRDTVGLPQRLTGNTMKPFARRILDLVLTDVLRRPCLGAVPRSGPEGSAVDCFSVMVETPTNEPYLWLTATDGSTAQALQWDGQRFTIATSIAHAMIDPECLKISHFLGLDTLDFRGLKRLAYGRLARGSYVLLALRRVWSAVRQSAFNLRSLGSQARVDTLRDLFQCCMESHRGASAIELMSYRHGPWWAGYPGWEHHHRRLDRLLELLCESGEIAKDGIRFKPTGRTIAIIEEAESEDRRHSANLRLQVILATLAMVTAVFTAAQANFFKLPTVFDWSSKASTSVTADARGPGGCLQLSVEPTK